jgi:hypothetical protein
MRQEPHAVTGAIAFAAEGASTPFDVLRTVDSCHSAVRGSAGLEPQLIPPRETSLHGSATSRDAPSLAGRSVLRTMVRPDEEQTRNSFDEPVPASVDGVDEPWAGLFDPLSELADGDVDEVVVHVGTTPHLAPQLIPAHRLALAPG